MTRSFSVVIAVWVVLLISSISAAAPSDAARAKQAFNEGLSLFEQGDFPAAANKFRTSYQTKKSYRILYNIGQAEAAAKRYGVSLEAFEKYLADGGCGEGGDSSPARYDWLH
jgi:tetratricopeptide (TPR) repeat protein